DSCGYVVELKTAYEENVRLQQEQIEALLESDRLKGEFLSVISHELRTPLNAITGFGSLLEDEIAGPLNPTQREFIAKLLEGSERMIELIENILDFASIRAGHLTIQPTRSAFRLLVEEAVALLQPKAGERGISLQASIKVPTPILLDRARILQALVNLLANAVKFSHDGGQVVVKAFMEGENLVAEVRDDGIGIAEKDLSKLFRPFVQLDMSLTRRAGGSGLGLSIARAVIEAHGGTIAVESPGLGKGSTFRFFLPSR
nr:hypothetical protein [Cyanobacteria bacterium UBA8530]